MPAADRKVQRRPFPVAGIFRGPPVTGGAAIRGAVAGCRIVGNAGDGDAVWNTCPVPLRPTLHLSHSLSRSLYFPSLEG